MIVRITPRAEANLESIFDESVDRWGIDQARSYTDAIIEMFDHIAERRVMWRSIPVEAGMDAYRCRAVRHFIYWRVTEHAVTIVAILHDRMDQARQLADERN